MQRKNNQKMALNWSAAPEEGEEANKRPGLRAKESRGTAIAF